MLKEGGSIHSIEKKKRESQAWGETEFDIERISARSDRVIDTLLLKRGVQNIDLVGKHIINVDGGHEQEAEFLLKNYAETVTIVDISQGQLHNARTRKEKHNSEDLECVEGGSLT
jgi:ubiquinone/menaquinone biosynthesis C-methylase UbiE